MKLSYSAIKNHGAVKVVTQQTGRPGTTPPAPTPMPKGKGKGMSKGGSKYGHGGS